MEDILLASRNDMIKALVGSEGTNIRQLTTLEGERWNNYWHVLEIFGNITDSRLKKAKQTLAWMLDSKIINLYFMGWLGRKEI